MTTDERKWLSLTLEELGELIDLFGSVYWSASAEYVFSRIRSWYPEITDEQIVQALTELSGDSYWHHCWLVRDDPDEPEITAEHLLAIDDEDFDRFLDARIEGPYCDHDEKTMRMLTERPEEYPAFEMYALFRFAKEELGLDEEGIREMVDLTMLSQGISLCTGESWVMNLLNQLRWGGVAQFTTIEQISRYRDLGNRLYQVLPNPVLKGWRPCDLKKAPAPKDDIPEDEEDIPDERERMKQLGNILRKAVHLDRDETEEDGLSEEEGAEEESGSLNSVPAVQRKVGRNDPCPCGSGKKYKKCCGKGQ